MPPQTAIWHHAKTETTQENRLIDFFTTRTIEAGALDTLILAVFHGDEPESGIVAQAFMTHFSTEGISEKRVGIIPVVNPDGSARQQRVNASGVDLNRNFPTQDWAEQNPHTIYYSGPSAASERETQFLLDILDQYPPQKIITLHTPYKVVNFDGPGEALAQIMAAILDFPVVNDIGYPTPGSFGTYVGKERHIPTITLELPEGNEFTPAILEATLLAIKTAVLTEA